MPSRDLVKVFRRFKTYYRERPVEFVKDLIGATPTWQQEELLRAYVEYKQIAVRSGHGTGKDCCASWIILHFLCCWPNARVVATAPTYRQLYDILKSEVVKWLKKSLLKDLFEVQKDKIFVKGFSETWWLRFVSISAKASPEEQAETLAGYHEDNLLAIIDEASGVPDPVFLPIESFLTKENNRVIMISNPTRARGYFYDVFKVPTIAKLWHRLHWDSEKSPNVSKQWIERYRKKYGINHPVYQVRVKGEFPVGGDNVLIPLDWVRQCVEYDFDDIDIDDERLPVIWGLDVARFGSDQTVLTKVVGPYVQTPFVTYHMDGVDVAEWAAEHIQEDLRRLVGVAIDVTGGIGAGPADLLRRWFKGKIFDVNFAWKAFHPEFYYLLRDELWWRARDACEKIRWSLPDYPELLDELSLPSFKEQSGRIKIQSKDELRSKGFGSPDHADSLVCTRYLERASAVARVVAARRIRRRKKRNWKVA